MTSSSPSNATPRDPAGEVARALRERDHFLIVSNVRPDGDAIGSTLGLLHALRDLGKRAEAYNPSNVPEHLAFLPGSEHIKNTLNSQFRPEVTVFVDCGSPDRVDKDFRSQGYVINEDHHATNAVFGDLNYIDIQATSVGEQIYEILERMEVPLTPEIATCLYLSIMTDTGGFRYPNTNARTFRVGGRLAEAGANPSRIAQEVYETRTPASIALEGQALANLHFECGGALVWSEITWEMYQRVGGIDHEPDGLVSSIRGIRGVEVSMLFHELEEGGLRVGIRSKGQVDVSALAVRLGGGGHHNASGAYILGDYAEIRERALAEARRHVSQSLGLPAVS